MEAIQKRVIIENVKPEVDGGRFPAKRAVGETVTVEADIFVDGHDALSARLLHRKAGESEWRIQPMSLLVNDLWRASLEDSVETGIDGKFSRGWTSRHGEPPA